MKTITGSASVLGLSILLVITSCLKAPKRAQNNSDAAVTAADAIGIESSGSGNASDAPPVSDGLAALHADQKSCVSCHEKNRPAPAHYGKDDCATCHSYPSFANRKLFSHLPKPPSCENCHARPAGVGLRAYPNQGPPLGFDPNNKNAPGSGHYVGKDCASCHATPAEGANAFAFSHSSPKADFCLPCHFNDGQGEHGNDADVILRDFGNCFSCHQNFDRNAARNFGTNGD